MIWKTIFFWVWNKLKILPTKTIFHSFLSTNSTLYYLWYWNCTNFSNPHYCTGPTSSNTIYYYIYEYTNYWHSLWMTGRLLKLKAIVPIIYILVILLSTIAILTNNPINLSLMIIFISIATCILINIELSSWLAIILFLIFVGGLIIIFSYFVRLRSNDRIPIYVKLYTIFIPIIILKLLGIHAHRLPYYNPKIYSLYSPINLIILLAITIILLFIIILITKIVKTYNAPLRGFSRSVKY